MPFLIWICAMDKGLHSFKAREARCELTLVVIPAQAGIQWFR